MTIFGIRRSVHTSNPRWGNSRWGLLLAGLIWCSTLVWSPVAGAGSEPRQQWEERILWLDESHQTALFLPESVTSSVGLDELPMKDYQRQILRESIQSFKASGRAICFQEERPAGQGQAPDARSLPELLADQDMALVGEIRALVDGYTPWFHRVVTAAYVEVKDVLHGTDVVGEQHAGHIAGKQGARKR